MKFFVSRQRYWGVDEDEGTVVEVAQGGLDYANPGMMGVHFSHLGEGQEFTNPKEAVEAAIRVCDAWRALGEQNAKVSFGFTGGNSLPFEPKSYDDLRQKAEELYEKLPKCSECSELLGKETYTHDLNCGDEEFCSENCADKAYRSSVLSDLHMWANDIFNDVSLDWEQKYDQIFSDDISVKVFNLVRLDYCDPDTSYEEDVTAFINAFNEKMKDG